MKSIVYILLAVFISSILLSAIPKSNSNSINAQTIKVQCTDSTLSSDLLSKSKKIIERRLTNYGLQKFDVSATDNNTCLEFTFSNKVDVNEVIPLLISTGKIEFYETLKRSVVTASAKEGDKLQKLLNIAQENTTQPPNSEVIMGNYTIDEQSEADKIISKAYAGNFNIEVNFRWSKLADENGYYSLYLLKKNPSIERKHISGSHVTSSKPVKRLAVSISFNEEGETVWQTVTRDNIGKPIAIVVDKLVYSAPIVMEEIKEGKCQISGNFSTIEAKQISALINNEELPLHFSLLK